MDRVIETCAPHEAPLLRSFGSSLNAAVIGASGGIGGALADALSACPAVANVFSLSRTVPEWLRPEDHWHHIDLTSESSIEGAAAAVGRKVEALHLVIVATGVLHLEGRLRPEKTWRSIDGAALETAFLINSIGPALLAKHFVPMLAAGRKSAFAALSARVGSIGDNRLGGWHAYRASKAALNMIIRTISIELERRSPEALCVALHPGTVDTALSRPFQGAAVRSGRLVSPQTAARNLLNVLDGLGAADSGNVYAWDGTRIPP